MFMHHYHLACYMPLCYKLGGNPTEVTRMSELIGILATPAQEVGLPTDNLE